MPERFDKKVVSVPMLEGIKAGIDPKLNGALVIAENALYPREGAIEKRTGIKRAAAASALSPAFIAQHNGNPVIFGGGGFEKYSVADDQLFTVRGSERPIKRVDAVNLHTEATSTQYVDALYSSNGFYVLAYTTQELAGGVPQSNAWVRTIDANTLAEIAVSNVWTYATADQEMPMQVVDLGNGKIQVYGIRFDTLRSVDIDTAGAISSETTVSGSVARPGVGNGHLDVCVVPNSAGNPHVCISFIDSATTDLKLVILDNGASLAGSATVATAGGTILPHFSCLIPYGDTDVIVAWAEADSSGPSVSLYAEGYDLLAASSVTKRTLESALASHNLRTIAGVDAHRTDADKVTIYATLDGGAVVGTHLAEYDFKLGDDAKVDTMANVAIAARPLALTGSTWVYAVYAPYVDIADVTTSTPDLPGTLIWMESAVQPGKPVARSLYRRVNAVPSGVLPAIVTDAAGDPAVVAVKTLQRGNESESGVSGFTFLSLRDSTAPSVDKTGNVLSIAGALPMIYDGHDVLEDGFLFDPRIRSAVLSAGGNLTADRTYKYLVVRERIDGAGNITRSEPKLIPSEPTATSVNKTYTAKVPVYAPDLSLYGDPAWKFSGFDRTPNYIALYRTIEDEGTVYYRVATSAQLIPDDASMVEIVDTMSDALAAEQEKLYTTGSILPNDPPPPHQISTTFQNRRFVVHDEDRREVWYSKALLEGESPAYSAFLVFKADQTAGDITALSALADKLIIFKGAEIWATEGEGFNEAGGGVNYVEPYLVSPSIGCIEPRSLVRVPQGLLFRAEDAIWLLDQGMQMQPVGDAVRYYTDTYTIVGAAAVPDRGQAIFTTSDGPALVFDWRRNRWATYSNHTAIGSVNVGNTHCILDSSGYVWTDDRTSYLDVGATTDYVPLRLDTGWFSFASIAGWQRTLKVLIVGQNIKDHFLRVKVAYNFNAAWVDDKVFDAGALQEVDYSAFYGDGLTPLSTYDDQAYTLLFSPSRQRGTAIRVQVSDEDPTGGSPPSDSRGMSITAIAFLVKVKRDTMRLGAARTIGV